MPSVSVVMPAYNSARVIRETLDSVLGQTFTDFEFIIVNDASSDETARILDEYARRDARIVVHHLTKNLGVGGATNYGVMRARGRYVARMDHDDIALPERLRLQVDFLDRHPDISVLGGRADIVGPKGRRRSTGAGPTEPAHVAWTMFFTNVMVHPTVMMRRSVLEAAGWYPAGYTVGTEDYALFLRLATTTKLAVLPEVVLHYRVWDNNATSKSFARQESEADRALQEALQQYWRVDVSREDATALRGLAINRYPSERAAIERTAEVIGQLLSAFVSADRGWTRTDLAPVRRDASMRLWMLTALMARRAPARAFPLARAAFRYHPSGIVPFVRKASGRAWATVARSWSETS